MGDHVCIMQNGEVAQIGRPMDVYLNPASTFVASFLGNPPMNLMKAVMGETGVRVAGATLGDPVRAPGDEITFGIRPEDLTPVAQGGEAVLSGRVMSVEPLGAETLIYVDCGAGSPVIVRGGRLTDAQVDETIHLAPASSMIRLFDPKTGRAIESRGQ